MTTHRHDSFLKATLTALKDRAAAEGPGLSLDPEMRIDGVRCLVTGASSGLGKAAAVELARRGGELVLPCRNTPDRAAEEVRRASGSSAVTGAALDLADLVSVKRFCDSMRDRALSFDIVLLNAGVVTKNSRRTSQGFETMFGVNFLAHFMLVERLLEDGVVRPASTTRAEATQPRIVFVSSESHRSAPDLDLSNLGAFQEFGMAGGMKVYGMSKLLICSYAKALARRLEGGGKEERPWASVHALCPGPVASRLAREAPLWVQPVLDPVMKLFFKSPEKASEPVLYLCCDPGLAQSTGLYFHMTRQKQVDPRASDRALGAALVEKSRALITSALQSDLPSPGLS